MPTDSLPAQSPGRWLRPLMILPALLSVAFIAYLYVVVLLPTYMALIGIESNVVYSIVEAARDPALLYRDPYQLPYSITQYMPLYYIINAEAVRAMGLNGAEALYVGRIVSAGAALLTYALVVVAVRREAPGLKHSTTFLLFGLLMLIGFPWHLLARPDSFVSLFLVASLFACRSGIRASSEPGSNRQTQVFLFAVAGVCAALCFWSKQNGLLSLICGLMLLGLHKERSGGIWLTAAFATTLAVIGLSSGSYLGANFFTNVTDGINNGSNLPQFFGYVVPRILLLYWPALLLVGICVALSVVHYRAERDPGVSSRLRMSPELAVVLFLLSVSLLSATKSGSGEHYLIDPMLVALLLLFPTFARHAVQLQVGAADHDGNAEVEGSGSNKFTVRVSPAMALSATLPIAAFVLAGIYLKGLEPQKFKGLPLQYAAIANYVIQTRQQSPQALFYANDQHIVPLVPEAFVLPHRDIVLCCALDKFPERYTQLRDDFSAGKIHYFIGAEPIQFEFLGSTFTTETTPIFSAYGFNVYRWTSANPAPPAAPVP